MSHHVLTDHPLLGRAAAWPDHRLANRRVLEAAQLRLAAPERGEICRLRAVGRRPLVYDTGGEFAVEEQAKGEALFLGGFAGWRGGHLPLRKRSIKTQKR